MRFENYEIVPYDGALDISSGNYTKLKLDGMQADMIGAMIQRMFESKAGSEISDLYKVSFPEGVSRTLMQYKTGGYGTPLIGENGKIIGHAEMFPVSDQAAQATGLYSATMQAAVMSCFTLMAVASGQYFLAQINDELRMIQSKLDDILGFLYGNQKSELIAQSNFVKYAFKNYEFIMEHEAQKTGVIAGLIESRKIAMKDIEFYLYDLESTIKKKGSKDMDAVVEKAFRIKDSLIFAMQLYGMSSLLEVYYAQNYNKSYLNYVENDISNYIEKCEKRMLGCFSTLKGIVVNAKGNLFKKSDHGNILGQINKFVESLSSGEDSELQKILSDSLRAPTKRAEYIMSKNGDVFMKVV